MSVPPDSLPPVPEHPEHGRDPQPEAPRDAAPVMLEDSSSVALSEALASSFRVVKAIMSGLVLLFLLSGVFVVEPNEVAVLLRLGRPVGVGDSQLLKPGWHFAFPYPIDEKVRIPIGQSMAVSSTTGWHVQTAEEIANNIEPQPRGSLSPEVDGYAVSADGNIIHARATVRYRITDPLRYEFGFTNVTRVLTNVVNNALIFAASRMTADAIIYSDKAGYRDLVLGRVSQKVTDLQLGIALEPSDVVTKAPADVRPAFEQVVATMQDRSKAIRTAEGDRDEMLRKAIGEAQEVTNRGLSASNRLVNRIESDVSRFNDLLPHFRRDRQLLEQRLLLTTVGRVMTNASDKFYQPARVDELRLQLSREPVTKPLVEPR